MHNSSFFVELLDILDDVTNVAFFFFSQMWLLIALILWDLFSYPVSQSFTIFVFIFKTCFFEVSPRSIEFTYQYKANDWLKVVLKHVEPLSLPSLINGSVWRGECIQSSCTLSTCLDFNFLCL